jgi:lysine 2,3-aminomutase
MNDNQVGSMQVSRNGALAVETEEPPSSEAPFAGQRGIGRRHPYWNHVPQEHWEDWRWQRQHAVRTTAQLAELLPLPPEQIPALEALETKYRMAIPPYYFSLIDVADPADPIRLQAVPSVLEDAHDSTVELDDPLEEDKDSPVPGLTHRYPDRALLVTTPVCSMYCRFCTRKRVTMDREGWDAPSRDEERMIEYVQKTTQIRDVIVSGGDPLTLPVGKLRWFIENLAAIEHVDVIRLGSRVPVTLPQRLFDPELIELLRSAGKIWIQTHFNHPTEITPEAERACRALVNAGMPVSNHAVLLKGVNDSVETMRNLVRNLLRIKVRPYYLFHCDPVTGAGHFRTSMWKGMEIIEGLRGHVSGLGVPTYVVDGVYGAGKIPVMPNYVLSASDQAVILRNYEGMIFRYAPDDRANDAPPIESTGVSNLLSGTGGRLMPEGNARMVRRKQHDSALPIVDADAANVASAQAGSVHPGSVHAANGHHSAAGAVPEAPNKTAANSAAGNGATAAAATGHAELAGALANEAFNSVAPAAADTPGAGKPVDDANRSNGEAKPSGARHKAGTNGHKPAKPTVRRTTPASNRNRLDRASLAPLANGHADGPHSEPNRHHIQEEQLTLLDLPVMTPEGLKTNNGRRRANGVGKSNKKET